MSDTGIALKVHAATGWRELKEFDANQIAEWMRANVVTLRALAALETVGHDGDHHEAAGHDNPMAKLEAKVDLVLYLLGELLKSSRPLPAAVDVTLHAQSINWTSGTPPTPHARGIVTLYLSPKLPWPLILPAQIVNVEGQQVRAQLLHLSEDAQEWLDRTLFRYHRRELQTRSR